MADEPEDAASSDESPELVDVAGHDGEPGAGGAQIVGPVITQAELQAQAMEARERIAAIVAARIERTRQLGIDRRTNPRRSALEVRIGGRTYPVRTVPTCHVCTSDWRYEIETMLLEGRTYAAITRQMPEEASLNYQNIRDHYVNGHLPAQVAGMRLVMEERATEVGLSIEEGAHTLADQVTLARLIVVRAVERLATGDIEPTIGDALKAAQYLTEVDMISGGNLDQQVLVQAMMTYMSEARRVMTPEQFRTFGTAIEANPVLQALTARADELAEAPA